MKALLIFLFMIPNAQAETQEVTSEALPAVVTIQDTVKESEIPLNIEEKKSEVATTDTTGRMVYSLAILLALGGGLWILLRRYAVPKNQTSQAQIKVLSQHHFGPKRSLALVRVAGESVLIGITDHNINLVKSLSLLDEEVPEDTPRNFSKTLSEQEVDMDRSSLTSDEDFAISGIKDIVTRKMKSMRNFQ